MVKRVQLALLGPPVEILRPVMEQLAQVGDLRTLLPRLSGRRRGPTRRRDSSPQVVQLPIGYCERERLDDETGGHGSPRATPVPRARTPLNNAGSVSPCSSKRSARQAFSYMPKSRLSSMPCHRDSGSPTPVTRTVELGLSGS